MGIAIFRGNHGYQLCGLTDPQGVILRLLMYLVSFVVVYTMLALVPDIKLPLTYVGRHTMGIYFFHYPIMIIMNGLYILMLPAMNNVWVLLGVSLVFVLVLGSLPVDLLYTGVLNLIAFILIKKDKTVRDEVWKKSMTANMMNMNFSEERKPSQSLRQRLIQRVSRTDMWRK